MNAQLRRSRMSRLVALNAIILTVLMMFGCGGGGGSSSDGGGSSGGGGGSPPPGSPEITVSSNDIAFSNLVATKQTDRLVTVQNTGTAGLVIGQIAQANPAEPAFFLGTDECSGFTLAPNGSCRVIVAFKPPTQGNFQATFNIPSNDADEPLSLVRVTGTGQGLNVTINKVDTSGVSGTGGTVKMIVSVTNASDVPRLGLDQPNFKLSEGVASQDIDTFSNTASSPVTAVLLLDYSESILPDKVQVQDAAKYFLGLLNPTDEVAVIKFSGEDPPTPYANFTHPITTDGPPASLEILQKAIDQDYTTVPGTKFYDAVYFSVERLAEWEPTDPAKRRTVIVVSDGVDYNSATGGSFSTQDLQDVIDIAKDDKVFIYTIGLGQDLNLGAATLGQLADETGGEYIASPTADKLEDVYFKVSQILSNQYELTFQTTKAKGTNDVSLKVVVDDGTLQGDNTVTVTY